MRTIDMDKTIEKMLLLYATYIDSLIKRRHKNDPEYGDDSGDYKNVLIAYDFLNEKVVKDSKKYLYQPQDMIYTGLDADGNPGEKLGKESVYTKLLPIVELENYYYERIIVPLSQKISAHVRSYDYDPEKVWTYSRTFYDSNAEEILNLNQRVHMLNSNGFVSWFQQFGAPQWFATKDSR